MASSRLRPVFFTLVMLVSAAASFAQDQKPSAGTPKIPEAELTEEEKKERDLRKTCKLALCAAFHNRKTTEGDVTCSVLKTWRKEQLTKMVSKGGVSWPWGNARCTTDLKFKRETLAKAMTEPEYEASFDRHEIKCELDREKDKYEVKVEIAPKVTFKNGKAVKAALNWGKIDAPLLAKSALWPATAADNSLGVLQNTVIDDINDFVDAKCTEVKDEWKDK
jgi:hypothetical protein